MRCESIRPLIRTFLDDLLDEKDYQDIQAHLGGCERCQVYAASVGTLSYRLYELGQVAVPPDLSSTVLYELEKKNRLAAAGPAVSLPEENGLKAVTVVVTRLLWAVVLLILVAAAAVAAIIVSLWRAPAPVPAPAAPEKIVAASFLEKENEKTPEIMTGEPLGTDTGS